MGGITGLSGMRKELSPPEQAAVRSAQLWHKTAHREARYTSLQSKNLPIGESRLLNCC